ncbi:MAG TPA: UDP-4-amino-4,6-dideoxy-N-acetyl-beta-L-altrosamine transaminase [Gammaproteobacteria bacterium]|nr:UDP-4-amino-4,6-dideoxy-N-acetyl-beta-L-altrosamine transaminase [Gammaproteobacteria bacterium]
MIPYGRQSINESDIEAVIAVLRSDFLTQGPAVPAFERAVAEYCGVPYAVACNSATSALHLACLALGLGPGDLLWTSPNTFVASANCARYCGADVDFVDIEPDTANLSPQALADKLARAARDGRLPRIVVPVHFAGHSCDMRAIRELADRYGFAVIEDASHAIGGRYDGGPVGDCRYSDITIFSFHPVKIVTTGEGGMATTRNSELARRMARLRTHGITREPQEMTAQPEGGWYYEQIELGFNYRMTDIQAALGRSQLARIDTLIASRRARVQRYHERLAGLPLVLPVEKPGTASAWHLYTVRLADTLTGGGRRAVYDALRRAGIGVNVHYIPVHLQPYYRRLGFGPGDFPVAEDHYARALTLPLFPDLSETDQEAVITAMHRALERPS